MAVFLREIISAYEIDSSLPISIFYTLNHGDCFTSGLVTPLGLIRVSLWAFAEASTKVVYYACRTDPGSYKYKP